VPFPTFLQTRSALLLEEQQTKTDAINAASTALWASGNNILPSAGAKALPNLAPAVAPSFLSLLAAVATAVVAAVVAVAMAEPQRSRLRQPWQFNPRTGATTRANLQQQQSTSPPTWQSQPTAPSQPHPWRPPSTCLLGPRPTGAPQAYTAYWQNFGQHNQLM
jgi:hypothetical protein